MASVYIYYLHDSSLTQEEYDTMMYGEENSMWRNAERLPIYAITCNKEYAKRFERERNMNHFIKVVENGFTKEDAKEFVNAHPGTRLEEMSYGIYQGVGKNIYTPVKYIDILSTNAEYADVSSRAEGGICGVVEFNKITLPYPYNYKNKYVDALETLEFLNTWKYLEYGCNFGDSFALKKVNGKDVDEIPDIYDDGFDFPDAVIDEVALFISLYGDMFNPAFFEEDKELKESKE